MVCGDCGGENRKNARFCSWCGLRIALRCAVCATDIVPGAEFCDACGTPVGEPADTPAPLGARKVVTVLFADLAGSTSQAEQMDPESVRGFMDAYYAVAREAVEGEGGRIVKLMGDGVMAAFGVPRVAEDDATRAVRAAAALQESFAGLADRAQQQFGTPVALRIGINTGEVVVAVGDNDVVGDAVNVASRLEAAAGPGEVVMGDSTWRLVRDAVTLEALEPLTVKGKAEPVKAFRLVALEPPLTAAPVGATSFVGRDTELSRLVDHFEEAVIAGETRVISVIGSPGVGKSRLSRELASALVSSARVLEAGCPPAGGSTFGPIADLLRDAGDLATDRDAFDRLTAMLGAGGPASPEALFLAIRRVLTDIATVQPLVVVLDDIHWAEPMLLDLLEHLAEWGRDAPILLVALARPELRDLRTTLAEGGRSVAGVIVLEGLGGEASQRLARDLLGAGDLPAAIAGKVLAVTQGNPLFLRELVRMLVDDGVLMRDGDAWITSVDAAELEVPPTVHALLSARIERLDADERIILERAAVIGPQFPRGGVAAIAPTTVVDDIDRHLEALRRRELVEPEGTYWGDEPLYRFHHVLIRDAAYRGLLREARADLHERYAGWLETKLGTGAAEQAEVLGFHLERAHEERQQLTGEPVAELGSRAAYWLALAGRRALERDDVGAAAGLLGRALDRAPSDAEERPSLLIDRAEAVLAAGDVTTGDACVTVLRTLCDGDRRLEAWAECFAGQLANMTDPGRLHVTVDEVAAAADRLTAVDDFAGAAKAHGVRAQALARLGQIAECEKALDKALAAARQAGDLRRANSVLAGAPLAALWGPSPVARASGKCLDVVRVLRITSGSPAVEATALRCQAVLEALRGRDDAARRMLAAARSSLEELGLRTGLLETDVFAGLIDLLAGDAAGAERHLRVAHDGFRELGVDVDAAQTAALLARALLAQSRDDEAYELTVESERLGGEDLKTAIAWRSARAEALARRGEQTEALRLARYAVTLAQPTDLVIDHADACTALASVLRLAGRHDEAAEQARHAADLYERKGATIAGAPEPTAEHEEIAPIQSAVPSIPLNTAARVARRRYELSEAHRWDEMRDLVSEQFDKEDRREGLRSSGTSRDEWVEEVRYIHSVPVHFELTGVATRGDRLSLDHMAWAGNHPNTGPFDGVAVTMTEVNPAGRIVTLLLFDVDDLDAAITELDRRYLAGEGAENAGDLGLVQAWIALYNSRDWDGYAAVWTPDFRVVDHRPAGWGELDGPGYVEVLQGMVDLAPDIQATCLTVDVAGRPVMSIAARGTAVTGGPIEIGLVMDYTIRDERLSQVDIYPPEQFAGVPAREPASQSETHLPRTRAMHLLDRTVAALNTGRWEAFEELLAPDSRSEDCRGGTRMDCSDRAVRRRNFEFVTGTGGQFACKVQATRGERLLLAKTTLTGTDGAGGPFAAEILDLHESNDDEQIRLQITFDADDFNGALAELDARYETSLSDEEATAFRLALGVPGAFNAGTSLDLARLTNDGFQMVDHTPTGFGVLDASGWAGIGETLAALAPDTVMRLSTANATATATLSIIDFAGSGPGGGLNEMSVVLVGLVREGRYDRIDRYSLDQLDTALARFTATATDSPRAESPVPPTRTTELIAHLVDAVHSAEWDQQSRLSAPNVVLEDRRGGTRLEWSPEMRKRNFEFVTAPRGHLTGETLATRGDALALAWMSLTGDSGTGGEFEVDFVQVIESDAAGLLKTGIVFDTDDLDAAFDELDARFCLLVPGYAAMSVFFRSFNARRWDELSEVLAPDFGFFDLPGGAGVLDRDSYVEYLRAASDLAPDVRLRVLSVPLVTAVGGVVHATLSGAGLGGGAIDAPVYAAIVTRADQLVRVERVSIDSVDPALQRFRELTSPSVVSNGITRLYAPLSGDDWVDRHWDYFVSIHAPDVVVEARTAAGERYRVEGRDQAMAEARSLYEVGLRRIEIKPLAVRGERLALLRFLNTGNDPEHGGGPSAVEQIAVCDANRAGQIQRVTIFEGDDSGSAIRELDARHAELSGSRSSAVEAVLDLLSERVEFEDPRSGLRTTATGREEVRAALRSAVDLGLSEVETKAVAARGKRLRLWHIVRRDPDSGAEVEHLVLVEFDDAGLIAAMVNFAIEDLDAAVAELDARSRQDDDQLSLSNTASRLLDPFDWDRFMAAPTADDMVVDDRRKGLYATIIGRDEANAHAERHRARRAEVETLAVRGDRLSLQRVVSEAEVPLGGGPAESEYLQIHEVNERGEVVAAVAFDVDDIDSAFEELNRRHRLGEGALYPASLELARIVVNRVNARDWDGLRDLFADDFVLVDHVPTGVGDASAAEWIERQKAMAELASDTRMDIPKFFRLHDQGTTAHTVALVGRTGSQFGGGVSDTSVLIVSAQRDGKYTRYERFSPDELNAALVRFDELHRTPETRLDTLIQNERSPRRLIVWKALRAYRRDWNAFAEALAPQVVLIDHRSNSAPPQIGRHNVVDWFRALSDLLADGAAHVGAVHFASDDAMALNLVVTGHDHQGGAVEFSRQVAIRLGDTGATRIEFFNEGSIDEAVAAATIGGIAHWLDNTAARSSRNLNHRAAGNVRVEDRRSGLMTVLEGADAAYAHYRAIDIPIVAHDTLAVRGDLLSLKRVIRRGDAPHGGGEAEISFLVVHETDAEGNLTGVVLFDDSDFAAAIAELDERYDRGEGAADVHVRTLGRRIRRAFNDRDWAAAEAVLTEDFEMVDHIPLGLGSTDRAGFLERERVLVDLAPDTIVYDASPVDQDGNIGLTLLARIGSTFGGGSTDTSLLIVHRVRGDRFDLFERFALEQADAALGRFEELRSTTLSPLDRLCGAIAAAINSADAAAIDRCFARDLVLEDHINKRTFDRTAYLEITTRLMRMPGLRASITRLVELGARHGVCRYEYTSPAGAGSGPWADVGGTETSFLVVMRLDDDGRFLRSEHFRDGDLLPALVRAEELYAEDEATGEALAGSHRRQYLWRFMPAYNRDWDEVEACFDPQFGYRNHRPTSFASSEGATEYIAMAKTISDVSADARLQLVGVNLLTDNAVVGSIAIKGRDREGGEFETAIVVYAALTDAGISRLEVFPADAVDEAIACAEAAPDQPFVSALRAIETAVTSGDLNAIADCFDEAIVVTDHITHTTMEKAVYVDTAARTARMPGVELSFVPVVALGNRHGVGRACSEYPAGASRGPWADVGGGESTTLNAIRVTDRSRFMRVEHFHEDDLLSAVIRAEEMYAEDEATGAALAGSRRRQLLWQLFSHYNGDWDAVAACLDPDFAFTDRRPLALAPTHGPAQYLELARTISTMSSDARIRLLAVDLLTDTAVVATVAIQGHDREGGEFETPIVGCARLGDGGVLRLDTYLVEDIPAALAAAQSIV